MSIASQYKPVGEDHGLALDLIKIDGGTQSRANLNQSVVDDYAAAIKDGATFPPIVVFYDGKKHWLADGFHRFHAYQKARRTKVAADIRQGTRRDAILHSVGANETHGLRRTRDDKRRAVLTLLSDSVWGKWTDREIGRACQVDHKTVGNVRLEVSGEIPSERTYTTKHGTTATMKTAGINASRKNAPEALVNDEPSPEAGPQAEASQVGTDTGMPADREGRIDGEAASVGLPTSPRNIFNELVALWNEADDQDREDFRTFIRPARPRHERDHHGAATSDVGIPMSASSSPSAATPAEAVAAKPQAPRPTATVPFHSPDILSEADPHSVTPTPPGETEKAGAAVPSSPAAPVRHSDPLDPGPMPEFLRRTS